MPTRRVSVKIALDGYEEYRATVTKLNNANKLFASELGVVDQKMKNNTNNVKLLKEKHDILKQAFDNQREKLKMIGEQLERAKSQMDTYAQRVENAKTKVDTISGALMVAKGLYGENSKEVQTLQDQLAQANKEYDDAVAYYNAAQRGVADMTLSYNNCEKQLEKLDGELVQNKIAQDKANGTYQDGTTYVSYLGNEYKSTGDKAEEMKDKTNLAIESIAKSEAFRNIKESVEAIKDALMDCIQASIDFESAFAGVAKTWHGSDEELEAFKGTLKDMSLRLPVTTEELSKVAESAGQLGIESKDIEKFVETMVGLGNATNITSDEAAILAAQFRAVNDFGTENIDRFASAVVWLGNNSATTEQNIMAMAQRLASAGTQAGLSAQDILGIATALSSTGIAAEAGGGSFSKFIVNLQTAVETGKVGEVELKDFAKVAGMTADEFATAWKKDPIIAIQGFVDGLASAGDEGKSAIGILQTLGITEIRMRNALLSLASGENKLTKYVKGSNDAWEENNALQEEVNKRYDTTESQVTLLNNNLDAMKREVGDALVPVIRDAIQAAIPIIQAITQFIHDNPELVEQIAKVTAAVIAATTAVATIGTVMAALSMAGGPAVAVIGLLTAGVLALFQAMEEHTPNIEDYVPSLERFGQAVESYRDNVDSLKEAYDKNVESINTTVDQAETYIQTLERLDKKKKLSKDEQDEYNKAVDALNELIPGLNLKIDKKTKKIEGGTQALRDQIQAWKDLQLAEEEEVYKSALFEEKVKLQQEMHQNLRELRKEQKRVNDLVNERNLKQDRFNELHSRQQYLTKEEREEYKQLHEEIVDLDKQIYDHNKNIKDLTFSINEEAEAMADVDKRYNDFENDMKGIDQSAKPVLGAFQQIQEGAENVMQRFGELPESADQASEKVKDAFDMESDFKRLADESMDAYIKRLKKMGMNDKEIQEIINWYEGKFDMGDAMYGEGRDSGVQYVKGVRAGIQDTDAASKAMSAAKNLAKSINNIMERNWGINSPSKVAAQYGSYYVEGIELGMESKQKSLYKEAETIAKSTNNIMDHSLDSSLIFGNEGSLDLKSSVRQTVQIKQDDSTQKDLTTMVGLMERYLPAFANMQVVMNSGELVGSIAPKIDEYFANEQLAHERGM